MAKSISLLGDCLPYMRSLGDNHFSLAIVDVPYGINASDYTRGGTQYGKSATRSKEYGKKDWDNQAPEPEYFTELFRVSKNQVIFGANHFIENLASGAKEYGVSIDSPCWLVWNKLTGNNGYADCEIAWTSFKSAIRQFTFRWQGMLQGNMRKKEFRIHPTQKPVELYKYVLLNYAKDGDSIFDSHSGSQSLRLACYDLGFDYTGCEIDAHYYNEGNVRFDKHIEQLTLF